MEEAGTFCVQCGRTDAPLIGAVCVRCFSERTPLASLPPFRDVVLCPTCGARQVGNHWERPRGSREVEVSRSDLEPHLKVTPPAELVRFRWSLSGQNPRLREVEATATVDVGGQETEVPLRMEVHILHHTCPECSRRGGHFYTARVQLRGPEEGSPRGMREFKPWALKLWNEHLRACARPQREAVAREEELKEGWDIFFMDTPAARAVARSFKARTGASAKETASLWGMRHGREVHRVTFLVRLPPVASGDHLLADGVLWEVAAVGAKGRIELLDVQRGVRREVARQDVATMRFEAGPEARLDLPVVLPPDGAPYVREPGSGRSVPLAGLLPDAPAEKGGDRPVPGHENASNVPVVLGKDRAWWAPHRTRRTARGAPQPHDSRA